MLVNSLVNDIANTCKFKDELVHCKVHFGNLHVTACRFVLSNKSKKRKASDWLFCEFCWRKLGIHLSFWEMDALVLHLLRSDFKTFYTEKAKIPEMVIKARRAFLWREQLCLYINLNWKVWKKVFKLLCKIKIWKVGQCPKLRAKCFLKF